jgi:membrane associated rhomboid family serine protease
MTPWVKRLIAVNVGMYLLQQLVPGLTASLELVPAFLLSEPWTIVTYMFLHGSIMHILFNMYALYLFGGRVEARLGGRHFMALYLLSGLGGGLLSFIAPGQAIIGASGAIMGVMAAYAMYWPREQFLFWGVLPVQAWMLVAGYVLLDVSGAVGVGGAGIAHFAHLGGLATGFLFLKYVELVSPSRSWRKKAMGKAAPAVVGNGDQLRKWREIRLDDLHPINRDEVVRLLKKAQAQGAKSLTVEERATLNRFAGVS